MLQIFMKIINKVKKNLSAGAQRIRKWHLKNLYKERLNYGKHFFLSSSSSIHLDITGSVIKFGHNVQVRDYCSIRSEQNGIIDIGDNVFFNNECSINSMGLIKVGKDCQFGEGVKLYDHNHKYTDITALISRQGYVVGEITIGSNCWIGTNVTILKDVHIGENVIIGAGCVIYKSIPSNSIVVNNQNLVIQSRLDI